MTDILTNLSIFVRIFITINFQTQTIAAVSGFDGFDEQAHN